MPITMEINEMPTGGKLKVKEVKQFLDKSYETDLGNFDGYELDKALSDTRVQVYKKTGTNEAVVVHRGTKGMSDWGVDLLYSLGKDISNTGRYKHAKKIQQEAESKYGANNISTLGHSLGSRLASDVGKNSKEIINLNKAVGLQDIGKTNPSNEFNIRTTLDPVSVLSTKDTNTFTIPSVSLNPLKEHSTDVLDRVNPDVLIGRGHVKKMKTSHLKKLIKKLPKNGDKFKVTGKKKHELVDYCCKRCALE